MTVRERSNKAAVSLRFRTMIGASACAIAGALALAGGVTSAQAATRCTWGGTPSNPTGTISFDPGLTQIPAPFALKFKAVGVVEGGGPCHGQTVIFDGQADAGSSCYGGVGFEGRVIGLPGVARVWGRGVLNLVRELAYDAKGNLVGSDQAIAVGPKNDPLFAACNTPQGFRDGFFSGEWDLFGS
jgi:hypothetical protein